MVFYKWKSHNLSKKGGSCKKTCDFYCWIMSVLLYITMPWYRFFYPIYGSVSYLYQDEVKISIRKQLSLSPDSGEGMGQSKRLKKEIKDFKRHAVEVYVEEQNIDSLSEEMLDLVLEEGYYMKDIPQNEGGIVTEIYYYRLK